MWLKQIDLKHIINSRPDLVDEDDIPSGIIGEICAVLEKDVDLRLFVDDIRHCKTVEEFNSVIDDLYDFCDTHRIWIN